MIKLTNSLNTWGSPEFEDALKEELEKLSLQQLPLQQGMTSNSYALEDKHNAMILKVTETDDTINVKTGIFFSAIIAGCSCADDPTPVNENTEYCEILLVINKSDANTIVKLLPE